MTVSQSDPDLSSDIDIQAQKCIKENTCRQVDLSRKILNSLINIVSS